MKIFTLMSRAACCATLSVVAFTACAADYPAPAQGSWVVKDFRFSTGETLPELRLNYTTVGAPTGEPVLILHGTTGSGSGLLIPPFAGQASRWTHRATTSSCPMPLAPANQPNLLTACVPLSPDTTTTTWWTRSTGW
jgi:poly(3-hydroxybutyrate) depolymerase